MPYIDLMRRSTLNHEDSLPETPGELNYKLTREALKYLDKKGESYQTYNDIAGAMLNAYMELYRRRIAVYEDIKCKSNGDVYTSK